MVEKKDKLVCIDCKAEVPTKGKKEKAFYDCLKKLSEIKVRENMREIKEKYKGKMINEKEYIEKLNNLQNLLSVLKGSGNGEKKEIF